MLAESALSSDTRMTDFLGVAVGVDLQGFSRDEGSDDLPRGLQKTPSSPPPPPARSQSTPSSSSKPTPPPPAPEPEKDVEMSEEEAEEAKAKADSLAAKTEGSEYYKQRQFSQAASEFSKAWDLWPKDIASSLESL